MEGQGFEGVPTHCQQNTMTVVQYRQTSSCPEKDKIGNTQMEEEKQLEWHELHYPLLNMIMEKLPFTDCIRFAAVCSWWRQVQRSSHVQPRRPQLPLLVYKATIKKETHTIINHSGMSRDIDLPGTNSKDIIGSAHGWLLYAGNISKKKHLLLNPLTNSRINLPGLPKKFSDISPAVISSDPSTTDLKRVNIMFMVNDALVYCRPGDSEWSVIETGEPYTFGFVCWSDMVACKGEIYVLTQDGKFGRVIVSYDNCSMVKWLIDEDRGGLKWPETPFCKSRFLVESLGDILLVLAYANLTFKIYKADSERMTWIEMPEHGDRSLFLGRCCSLSASASETGGRNVYMSYPDDNHKQEWEKKLWNISPELEESIWTWKLSTPWSNWHWMLPSF